MGGLIPANMEPAFMGDSTGHWEGDTLVVDTVGLKGPPWTWLDTAGHQHGDELHVTERFSRTADNIQYEYTLDDPIMYVKPWTLSRVFTPLKLNPALPELIEYSCSENNQRRSTPGHFETGCREAVTMARKARLRGAALPDASGMMLSSECHSKTA